MRKPLASRIFGLAALYCAVFFTLVILQFSSKGSFNFTVGAMSVKGRYLPLKQQIPQTIDDIETSSISRNMQEPPSSDNNPETDGQAVAGGVRIFFGGLEFNLKEDGEKGLVLTGTNGSLIPVNPQYMTVSENTVRFSLIGGNALVFYSVDSARGPELQISAELADNVSEITMPITPRRSSLIRDSGQIGVLYNSSRYFLGTGGEELENSRLVLSRGNSFISYRSRGKQRSFDTADYIIAQEKNYESELASWQDQSYTQWRQNAAALQNESDIIAYCSEALRQNSYTQAVGSITDSFINGSRHSFRSAAYVGGMTGAYSTFTAFEREKSTLITRLARDRSAEVFKEEHALDYLFARGNISVANDLIETIKNTSPEMITSSHCPGLLEAYMDLRRWRPSLENPVDGLTDQILSVISENLSKDADNKLVFASNDLEYSIRLGKALIDWAQTAGNNEWASIGRSLVLSALTSAGHGAGNLYCILQPGNYYPRSALLVDNGLWAWTVSPSINASYPNGNLNIAVSFPISLSHYVIIKGVRPFIKIRIHDMDWRTDSQFERYDSSGWVYHPQDQILILKVRHRETTENIRIIYVPEEVPESTGEEEGEPL